MFGLSPKARFRLYINFPDYLGTLRRLFTFSKSNQHRETLETSLKQYLAVENIALVPQARVGIFLAVQALVPKGKKIILSPYTIADVINMVILAGAKPVFADIDRATTNISLSSIESLIDNETAAVMITHLHGISCEVEKIVDLCKSKGLALIEDSAQAFGARIHGKALGTFGDAGIYSFGLYKNISGFYGGALIFRDPSIAKQVKASIQSWKLFPLAVLFKKMRQGLSTVTMTNPIPFKSFVYWIFRYAYLHRIQWLNRIVTIELDTSRKSHLPDWYLTQMREVQAYMVLRRLKKVDKDAKIRIEFARLYWEGLHDIEDLIIPPLRLDGSNVYNYFPIQYNRRDDLIRHLMQQRRDIAAQHLKNCAALPSFRPEFRDCPNADATSKQVILLPNYPTYGRSEVIKNINAIRAFFKK